MTGSSRTSDGLDARRRRALFRAWRRGTRELDLLLGPFADAHIESLGDHDLADFEALLDAAEGDVFAWLTGREPVAPKYATATYRAIVAFNAGRHEQD
jgi:antitoxin CptB